MRVSALICNHAEIHSGLLYLSGAGIDRVETVPGSISPWFYSMALSININLPWLETNKDHILNIKLIDFDSKPVYANPNGDFLNRSPLSVDMGFRMERGPYLQDGEAKNINMVLNLPVLILEKLGTYVFVLSIDAKEECRVSFRLSEHSNELSM